ncbi:hypothetical protein LTS18_000389 [Coniosporium uncinatum]|uniref:Uncharacterized protein n=1 Tax=Coniosporium uncinatum TaxID=93489 RepID=A0ACC3D882_9PEZI|nr:hypothetical protein LTS18_000389 [Coniosporium uncinatum]
MALSSIAVNYELKQTHQHQEDYYPTSPSPSSLPRLPSSINITPPPMSSHPKHHTPNARVCPLLKYLISTTTLPHKTSTTLAALSTTHPGGSRTSRSSSSITSLTLISSTGRSHAPATVSFAFLTVAAAAAAAATTCTSDDNADDDDDDKDDKDALKLPLQPGKQL